MELEKFLSQTALFEGISETDIGAMLGCLGARRKRYDKNETVLYAGDTTDSLGLVLSGSVQIERVDAWGNRLLMHQIPPGQVFAEVYACAPEEPLAVNAVAAEASEIMFIAVAKVAMTCQNSCSFHRVLATNLLRISAKRNLLLNAKLGYLSLKTIRARVIAYLSDETFRQGARTFEIPFNRQELADFLSVERSALSNELSKMRTDGLIDFDKNHFRLLTNDAR